MFDFDEGLGADFGDAEWDLTMPSKTASKDSSDIESLLLSTDMIVTPSNTIVVLALPSVKDSLSKTISVPQSIIGEEEPLSDDEEK